MNAIYKWETRNYDNLDHHEYGIKWGHQKLTTYAKNKKNGTSWDESCFLLQHVDDLSCATEMCS